MSYKLTSAGVDIFQFISWLRLELFCVGWNISWCGLELIHWSEIIRILGYSSISRTRGRMFIYGEESRFLSYNSTYNRETSFYSEYFLLFFQSKRFLFKILMWHFYHSNQTPASPELGKARSQLANIHCRYRVTIISCPKNFGY